MLLNSIKKSSLIIDFIIALILIVIGHKYISGFEFFTDVMLYDESNYLYQGINLIQLGLPSSGQAPLYSIWYFFQSLFQPDSLLLYYLNYELITMILPVFFYFLLRRFNIALIPAFFISIFLMVCSFNFQVVPKVSHFAIVIIFLSLILSTFFKTYFNRITIILIGSLLSSYIRPELFISFIIFISIFFYIVLRNYRVNILKINPVFYCTLLIVILCLLFMGIPISNGERSFLAFSQHFSLNWIDWNKSELSPWTNYQEIIIKNFGNVNSIPEAFRNNPGSFIKHIEFNINNFPSEISEQFNHATLVLPSSTINRRFEILILMLLIILYVIFELYTLKENIIVQIRNNFHKKKELWFNLLVYIIPVLLSIFMIYPREHYLLMFTLFSLIILLTGIFIQEKMLIPKVNYMLIFILMIIALFMTPKVSALKSITNDKSNVLIINFLRDLQISGPVNILEAAGGYNIYLGSNYKRIAEYEKDSNFLEFLRNKEINMVVVDFRLCNYNRFKNDSEWEEFLQNYTKYNFSKKYIPEAGVELLISDNLLE